MSSNKSKRWFSQGCQTPRLQILRIDREGVIDDLISHGIWRLCSKNTRWPDRHEYAMFHIIAYLLVHCNGIINHTEVYEETFDVNSKKAQTMQNI